MIIRIPAPGEQVELSGVGNPLQVQIAMSKLIKALRIDDDVNMIAAEVMKAAPPVDWPEFAAKLAYDMAYFEPDPPGRQLLRTPRRTILDRRANCVDYTLFIGAVCYALGCKVVIRIVQFDGAPNFGHVFPIVNNIILDVVPGQDQNGNEWKQRTLASRPKIGVTVPYLRYNDLTVV